MQNSRFLALLFFSGFLGLSACTQSTTLENGFDPVEPVNRVSHNFNKGLDTVLIRPVATGYEKVVPNPIKQVVNNEVRFLSLPRTLANSVLQGNLERAGNTAARIVVNGTIGGLGLLDPATNFNIPEHDEDFGQTLAVWGLNSGPYLELPLFGPSSVRGVAGRIGDLALDPLAYISGTAGTAIGAGRRGAGIVDTRYRFKTPINEALYQSPDSYVAVRNLYLQRREAAILNGIVSEETLPDLNEAEDF